MTRWNDHTSHPCCCETAELPDSWRDDSDLDAFYAAACAAADHLVKTGDQVPYAYVHSAISLLQHGVNPGVLLAIAHLAALDRGHANPCKSTCEFFMGGVIDKNQDWVDLQDLLRDPGMLARYVGAKPACDQAFDDGPFGVVKCTRERDHGGDCHNPQMAALILDYIESEREA